MSSARSSCSRLLSQDSASEMTGRDTVSPWLPLPEFMTTGIRQPLILASLPEAAMAAART